MYRKLVQGNKKVLQSVPIFQSTKIFHGQLFLVPKHGLFLFRNLIILGIFIKIIIIKSREEETYSQMFNTISYVAASTRYD
jgi:hypothetical protein